MYNRFSKIILTITLSFICSHKLSANVPFFSKKKKSYKAPSYSSNIILDRIYELELEVDFRLNGKVKSHIKNYTVYGRQSAERILGKTTRYFPAFEYYNEEYNLPDELKCLMIIESRFDPMATSSTGAKGLWQLMPATARSYGLKIDDYVDERCDPYKSTEAALKHLSHLYDEFNNWTLAIAAYNCGSKRVKQAMKKSKSKSFWKIKKHLPKQTQDYIHKFIATNYVVDYYMFYDLRPVYPDYTYQMTEPIVVFKFDKLTKISRTEGVELNLLRSLNPSYKKGIVPMNNEGNILILPKIGREEHKQTAGLLNFQSENL